MANTQKASGQVWDFPRDGNQSSSTGFPERVDQEAEFILRSLAEVCYEHYVIYGQADKSEEAATKEGGETKYNEEKQTRRA